MNQTITIENFKCFAEKKRIDLGGITVCAGMNSVGKSSLIQSFLLVRQIFDAAGFYRDTAVRDYEIRLNGVYGLQLGDSQRIKSSMDKDDIFIYIDDIRFRLCSIPDKPMQLTIENMYSLQELEERQGIFSKRFYYLNAERQGPRKYQDITGSDDLGCGIHGENTFHLLREREIDRIEEGRMFPFDKGKRVNTVGKQVEYWMNYIIPGVELNVKELNNLGISQLEVRQQVFDTGFMSPCNFGFGISYVLPIVLSGLLAEKQGMLIIENPEAHLHPAGQSRIGYFLAMMAKAGVQIILETHSEHVINGIRIAALQLEMETEDICINYFSIDHEKGEHRVERIELNERMDLLKWPDGFLDQEEQDLEGAYESEDFAGWIYSRKEPELADVKKELMIRMSKCCHCEDIEIKQQMMEAGKARNPKYFALDFREEDNCNYAASVERAYEICRRYLGTESKSEFKADLEFCFPDIYFDKTVSGSLNSINRKFEEIRTEIVEHLTALNNYKQKFIKQVKEKKGYREIAMEFQRDSGIECSPQGDKKRIKVFMREFVNERTGKKENINCELHTKFKRFNIDKDKQDRIYFAPAREGICSGKVILIHIGDHLNKGTAAEG